MTSVFPFAFESSLSFYLVVYVLTLVLHAWFMTYVLAGSMFLAWAALFPGAGSLPRALRPLAKVLREWMPFVLSAAITAGVAPLLFVQIIYRQEFYTANLLLGWRWMVVIPVLVVAFYLLYVVKSKLISDWSFATRCALAAGIAGSFLFVAFCWTTNHLLQIDSVRWPEVYARGNVIASSGSLLLRLLTWVCGAFPVMSISAGWQLAWLRRQKDQDASACDSEVKTLSRVSLAGLGLAAVSAVCYSAFLNSAARTEIVSTGGVWLLVALVGAALQSCGWFFQLRQCCFCSRMLAMVSAGGMMMLAGTGFLREIIRVSSVNAAQITANTKAAADVGGFLTFVSFTVVNAGLIVLCLRLIRPAADETSGEGL